MKTTLLTTCFILTLSFLAFGQSALLPHASNRTQPRAYDEYKIKAKFLTGFLKFTEFDDSEKDPLIIAVLGKNPFQGELLAYQNKTIHKRNVKIVFLGSYNEKVDIPHCHILFITATEKLNQRNILPHAHKKAMISIGENKWFIKDGGMVNFGIHNNKFQFEINQELIKNHNVRISSKILRLAKKTK